MKKAFLIFVFSFSLLSIHTESRAQRVDDLGNEWVVKHSGWGIYYEVVKSTNDTVIDGERYVELSSWVFGDPVTMTRIDGYIREKNNKIYFRKTGGRIDLLHCDFSLNLGDSTQINVGLHDDPLITVVVQDIDTIFYNGVMRKVLTVQYDRYYTDKWIEGIGSSCGLYYGFRSAFITDSGTELNCFQSTSEQLLFNSDDTSCPRFPTLDNQEEKSDFYVYNFVSKPNSIIVHSDSIIHNMTLYNAVGSVVWRLPTSSKFYQISTNGFSAGNYYLEIQTGNNDIIYEKVMVY